MSWTVQRFDYCLFKYRVSVDLTVAPRDIETPTFLSALDRLGFSDYTLEAEAVLKDCKAVAAKRRRQSTRLENLGIPEEELLRQQQELFAKVTFSFLCKSYGFSKNVCIMYWLYA